jgi:hypothetical protein
VQASHTPKRAIPRVERHPVSIAERPRTTPPAAVVSAPPIATSASTSAPASAPAATISTAAAAPAASNAQFLEELRAIHAEIDARKRHMDSLTAALDSLKHITKPN